jgi:hypothetical protein
MEQAGAAITRYGVHAVVANILDTRKEVVQLVRRSDGAAEGVCADTVLRDGSAFIEEPLVERLVKLHSAHVQSQHHGPH